MAVISIRSIKAQIGAFLIKAHRTLNTQVLLQWENAEHPQHLNPCCEWDTSLPFLGQQLCFCQAATHLQGEHSLSDHTEGIIKKTRIQGKFLGIKLIRHQRTLPAPFTQTVYPKIHILWLERQHHWITNTSSKVFWSIRVPDESHFTQTNIAT